MMIDELRDTRPPTTATAPEPTPEAETLDIAVEDSLRWKLANSQLQSAQLTVKLREEQLAAVINGFGAKYSELGKYTLSEVNLDEGKLTRVLTKSE